MTSIPWHRTNETETHIQAVGGHLVPKPDGACSLSPSVPDGQGPDSSSVAPEPSAQEPLKFRVLDLFCGAGGAAMGYSRAGFEVVGMDIVPQPNYPFEFHQGDALDVLESFGSEVAVCDAIHASPPCQFATDYKRRPGYVKPSSNLIPATRELLQESGLPYVIENVLRAHSHLRQPVAICGVSLSLDVRRHRLFETNFPLLVPPCSCGNWKEKRFPGATNRAENSRRTVEVGVWRIPLEDQLAAMGVDWMTREELSQAIPPSYTELIGHQLMQHLSYVGQAS